MPVDPAVAALLDFRAQQQMPGYEDLTIEQIRAGSEMLRALQKPPQEVAAAVDAAYGPEPEQAVRVYVPRTGAAPYPVLVHYHGGGFVTGSLDAADEPCRALANDVEALVVSVTYRKAPESTFPAAHDDAWAALGWAAEHAGRYGGDPARLAVMGDSAGGNLAASVAVRARDEGRPAIKAIVLLYPLVSPAADTASRREYAQGYIIDAPSLEYFRVQYAASPRDELDPRLDLDRTPALAGLPPTLVLTNEYDMIRDEGEAFARRLAQEGVDVTAKRFDGLVHIVYWMSAAVPKQAEMHADVVQFLRSRLT
ncbi:MAG: alpha/beta hydrolase [Dermatophilaceae bacterium]